MRHLMTNQSCTTTIGHRKASFAADTMKLVSGTTIALALGILAAPLLTRLYAPEAFGTLALFTSITGILGVVGCMRYELAIMLPETDEEAANLLGVSIGFSVLISLLTVPVIWWGKEPILRWLNAPRLAPYLWLVPILVFIHGVFLALNYWNSRTRHFGRLSIARVTSSVATTATKLSAGYAGYATAGTMIGANVGGQALATTVLGGQIWRDDGRLFRRSIRLREMFLGVKQHRKFPIFSTWSSLLNTISIQLPALLIAVFFSPVVVGFYALSHRILSVPMSLIGSAIGQVFFQRASQAKNDGTLPLVVENTFMHLLLIAGLPFLLLIIIGPEVFMVVFGARWIEAGVFAQILAPWLFFVFLGSPISTLYIVLERQEIGLVFNIILVLSRAGSLIIGSIQDNIFLALMLFSASGTIMWACLIVYLISYSGVRLSIFVKTLGAQLFIVTIFLLPVVVAKWLLDWPALLILVTGTFATVLYYAYVIFRDDRIRSLIAQISKGGI